MPKKKSFSIIHYRSKAYWLVLAVASVLSVGAYLFTMGIWAKDNEAPHKSTVIPPENLMLVHEIERGTTQELEPNIYRITVKNSHPRLVYFSAAPLELVGNISMSEYRHIWANQFSNNHPYGALLFDFGKNRQTVTIVELLSMDMNESAEEVTYTARLMHIDETKHMLLHRDALQIMPEEFEIASLFIDGYPTKIDNNDYGYE